MANKVPQMVSKVSQRSGTMYREAGHILKQTVSRQDVESKPPGTGLRRVCVVCTGLSREDS